MASLANTLTARARAFRQVKTPVQREIDLVLRVMVVLILVIGGPIVLDLIIRLLGELVSAVGGPFAGPLERAYQAYSVQETVTDFSRRFSSSPVAVKKMRSLMAPNIGWVPLLATRFAMPTFVGIT